MKMGEKIHRVIICFIILDIDPSVIPETNTLVIFMLGNPKYHRSRMYARAVFFPPFYFARVPFTPSFDLCFLSRVLARKAIQKQNHLLKDKESISLFNSQASCRFPKQRYVLIFITVIVSFEVYPYNKKNT